MSSEVEGTPELEAIAATPAEEPETETPESPIPEGSGDETAEGSEPEEQPSLTIRHEDGTEETVTAEEARRGYLRERDYTQKTMALAERQRAIEDRQQRLDAVVSHGEALVVSLAQEFEADFANVDWDKLAAEDPAEYIRQSHLRAQRGQKVQAKLYELNQAKQSQRQHAEEFIRGQVAEEGSRLLQAMPEWKDSKRRETESAEVRDYLARSGYRPEEVSGVTDHRAVVLARKAMLYDRQMAKLPRAAPQTAAPPPPPPIPSRAKGAPNPDKMPMDQWLKWRNAQVARKQS